MGVRGLMPLLARFAPKCITMPLPEELAGWTVAVDSNIFIQRFFKGTDGGLDSLRHLRGMRNLGRHVRALGVTPIFVFDGKFRAAGKEVELTRRNMDHLRIMSDLEREQARAERIRIMNDINLQLLDTSASQSSTDRSKAVDWLRGQVERFGGKEKPRHVTINWRIEQLEADVCRLLLFQLGATRVLEGAFDRCVDSTQALASLQKYHVDRLATLQRRTEPLTPDMVADCVELMAALGFATHVVDDTRESEGVCAHLCRHGVAEAVCSEDLDVVVFGARLLRGFYSAGTSTAMRLVDVQVACTELGLSHRAFVDLCILCGTDFASTIEKVGSITALRLMREFGSIERILDSGKFCPRPGFHFQIARDVFLADAGKLPFSSKKEVADSTPPADPIAVDVLLPPDAEDRGALDARDPFARELDLP
ncbi:PIN domain-like protein [Coemansia reversa NRRL 1564]|uniref:PIN domain-like protein n=1 Tax=Coemansia reversa (strain ATCC 12441 / NRRL 1564) TaxID=763665 RepID=A0A2G5BGM5_COERN|nr:PIN domain-like protein [Coemansia reversa NRRL 1564]|eukprot:PIA18160.1 PIN domain-like protein [Coemansia reversa NRRL 1564]